MHMRARFLAAMGLSCVAAAACTKEEAPVATPEKPAPTMQKPPPTVPTTPPAPSETTPVSPATVKITTVPPGAKIKGSGGVVVCAATPCDIPNSDKYVGYDVELEGYKRMQISTQKGKLDQILTLVSADEPDWVGCNETMKCVPASAAVTSKLPSPFEHCKEKLDKDPGDPFKDSGFSPARTREKRKTDANACCYLVGYNCPTKGRPLRDGARSIVAASASREDWTTTVQQLAVDEARAVRWIDAAAAEHASVASFSRFSLDLLALGAPPDLVTDAHQAALDEIEHARMSYAIASAYAGRSLGPGPLQPPPHAPTTLVSLAVDTFRDGCVEETIGVATLREDARLEPQLASILHRIADDEERHAELAWRTIAWAAREGGEPVRSALRAELSRLDRSSALRARTIDEVVIPCLTALLAETDVAS